MVTQGDVLSKLQTCVGALGREWQVKSDGMFINEYGLQSRLAQFLWSDDDLWFQNVLLKQGQTSTADFPAVYREWYVTFGTKNGYVDIAILGRDSVSQWVSVIRHGSPFARPARELPVFVGLQIKSGSGAAGFEDAVRTDLDNLLAPSRIEYRCQLIFYDGAVPRQQRIIDGIVIDYQQRILGHDTYIYLCPCSDPQAKPVWVPNWILPSLQNRL